MPVSHWRAASSTAADVTGEQLGLRLERRGGGEGGGASQDRGVGLGSSRCDRGQSAQRRGRLAVCAWPRTRDQPSAGQAQSCDSLRVRSHALSADVGMTWSQMVPSRRGRTLPDHPAHGRHQPPERLRSHTHQPTDGLGRPGHRRIRPSQRRRHRRTPDRSSIRLTIAVDFTGHGIGKLLVPLVVRGDARKRCRPSSRR